MKAFIELEAFATHVKLPDGIHFKEWDNQGCIITFAPDGDGQYLNTHMVGLERDDGKLATFEFASLKQQEHDPVALPVSELAQAVDKAIAELEK